MKVPLDMYLVFCPLCGCVDMNEVEDMAKAKAKDHPFSHTARPECVVRKYQEARKW